MRQLGFDRCRWVAMSVPDLLDHLHNYIYIAWIPNWLLAALTLVTAASAALLLDRAALRLVHRLVSPRRAFLHALISAMHGPLRMALVIVAISIVLPFAPL